MGWKATLRKGAKVIWPRGNGRKAGQSHQKGRKSSTIRDAASRGETKEKSATHSEEVKHHADGRRPPIGRAPSTSAPEETTCPPQTIFTQCCYTTTINITTVKDSTVQLVLGDSRAGGSGAFHRLCREDGGSRSCPPPRAPHCQRHLGKHSGPAVIASCSRSHHFSTTTCLPKPHIFDKGKTTRQS